MSFKNLGLLAELVQAIHEMGYSKPTPVQEQAIPMMLAGHDLMVGSQTGTGKTASYGLPLLQHLSTSAKQGKRPHVRALILTPTRELAMQVTENMKTYGKHLHFKSIAIFGGVNIQSQIKMLQRGVDIVIATPGRLLDHVLRRTVDLSKIELLILDEADRMLDMGFINDIQKILALLPKNRQSLLFSATFSKEIKHLAANFLRSPKTIEAAQHNTPAPLVAQTIYPVDSRRKRELLSFLISSNNWQQVLVFTRTKHGADRLSKQLLTDGITSIAIHGDKTQGARSRALADFKRNAARVLVATDVAARGLDIEELPRVVNFDLPDVPEDYVHRIGRTGRAGKEGEALSLVCIDERKNLQAIEHFLNRKIPNVVVPGYEIDLSIKASAPNRRFRNRRPNRSKPKYFSK